MPQLNDQATLPDAAPEPQIASRMRFKAPNKFLEFYEKQLSRQVVGLRHPTPIAAGAEILVIISPPGHPDRLRLLGRVTSIRPRPDGTLRLRVDVALTVADAHWLTAFVEGLQAALAFEPPPPAEAASPSAAATPQECHALASTLDQLTYYQLLDVKPNIEPDDLQAHFHRLTRRYHPDLFYGASDRSVTRAVNRVYRRMNEAYATLKSTHRRRVYDDGLSGPPHTWKLRLSESDQRAAEKNTRVRRGSTQAGDHYWTAARGLLERAREGGGSIRPALREAARLLRTAIAFEPHNEHFSNALSQVTDRLQTPEP